MDWRQILGYGGTGAATGALLGGPIGAAIGVGGGVLSGILQSDAQNKADAAQQQEFNESLDFQKQQWEQEQQNLAPYLAAGKAALPQMQAIAANAGNINPASDPGYRQVNTLTNPGQFSFSTTGANADPSYTWRLQQGLGGVNSSAAAGGGFFSGNTMTALNNYAQGAASQEYQNQFNRWQTGLQDYMNQESFNADQYNQAYNRQMGIEQNQYNQFASLAGLGQTAVNQVGSAGSNYATNASNLATNYGNQVATGDLNQGNIWSNTTANTTNQFMAMLPTLLQQISRPTQYGSAAGPAY